MFRLRRSLFTALPYFIQLPLAQAFCAHKKKRIKSLQTPVTLIFFVTSRCNLRCTHCFFWKELNTEKNELTLDEIRLIARSFKHPVSLSLTGGEPFIRDDLKEICMSFHQGCGAREIGFATNGTLIDRTVRTVEAILAEKRFESVSVQVSLDGLKETHDHIRGVAGAFDKAIETLQQMKRLRATYPELWVKAALTVQKSNISELREFVEFLLPFKIPLRFNITRGGGFGVFHLPVKAASGFDPKEISSFLTLDEIGGVYDLLKELNRDASFAFWPRRQQRIWELSMDMLERQACDIPCYARHMESVLYADGKISFCELSKPFGNIRDFHYDFSLAWKSSEAEAVRGLISRCCCIHGCNLTTGLTFEPETIVSVLRERQQ